MQKPTTEPDLQATIKTEVSPLRGVEALAVVVGGYGAVVLRQRLCNDGPEPIEATCSFRLPAGAALTRFSLQSGEQILHGQVQPVRAIRRDARHEILPEPPRDEVAMVSVSSVLPGEEALVEVEYVERLQLDASGLRWRLPAPVAAGLPRGSRGLHLGLLFDLDRPISIKSASRSVRVDAERPGRLLVRLASGEAVLHQDMILHARIVGEPGAREARREGELARTLDLASRFTRFVIKPRGAVLARLVRGPAPPGPGGSPGGRKMGVEVWSSGSTAKKKEGALCCCGSTFKVHGCRTANPAERKEKLIKIEGKISLPMLAEKMSLKATEVLMKLIQMGTPGVNINSSLDVDTATLLANEFGWDVEALSLLGEDCPIEARILVDDERTESRPPVVSVLGHLGHGKTSLLDQIRKTSVAAGEVGGITQHIGAYRVQTPQGIVTFVDTPGHEAFSAMRARSASLGDIVVLVVAADDGVMPQTREAIAHAKAARVPILVAVTKVDSPGATSERVNRQLMVLGLVPEVLGGDTPFFQVSARMQQGIDDLLETILQVAENALELRANPERDARAVVVEAMLDRSRGPVARILVRDGTLKVGDFVLSGMAVGKIRAMTDDTGRQIKKAGPSTPVEITGLSEMPCVGDTLDAVNDPKKAQEIAEQRKRKERAAMRPQLLLTLDGPPMRAECGGQFYLSVLVKADAQGSVEAIHSALQKLKNPEVKLSIVDASAGDITESDINLAIVAKAIVVGFNVRPNSKAAQLAQSEGVSIALHSLVDELVAGVRLAMEACERPG